MLTSGFDENGDATVAYGPGEAVVTLDYASKYDSTAQSENPDKQGLTTYTFVIKNGIKFSDGQPLTIEDVLFNLYVYLDPVYMGSATIYSTDIVGLKAYRAQDPNMLDSSDMTDGQLNAGFYAEADTRLDYLINHLTDDFEYPANEDTEKDIARTKELFREEAESNWSMTAGTLESYEEKYSFTEDWQIYYYNMGVVRVAQEATTRKTMYIDPETRATFVGEEAAKAAVAAGTIKEYKYMTNLDPEANEMSFGVRCVADGEGLPTKGAVYDLLFRNAQAAKQAVRRDRLLLCLVRTGPSDLFPLSALHVTDPDDLADCLERSHLYDRTGGHGLHLPSAARRGRRAGRIGRDPDQGQKDGHRLPPAFA
jgi:hypothetical protein